MPQALVVKNIRSGALLLVGSGLIFLIAAVFWRTRAASGTPISLTALGTAYTQNFDTLANSGTSGVVPAGWAFVETGTSANTDYTAGTGSSATGDTYSFGANGAAERAFGALQSGSNVSTVGAGFNNQTNGTITSLTISYNGEQWRLGTTGRADKLDFQYSADATSLTNGTWQDVDQLDFSSPVTTGTVGALNGNTAPNRAAISFTINNLLIANGTGFFIRWTDANATGSDDGLAIDDFSVTPNGTAGSVPALAINDVTANEGNNGTTAFTFNVSLSAVASAPVTFDLATQDGTATTAGNDYQPRNLTAQTITPGVTNYQFTVNVNGDTITEANETFNVRVTHVNGAIVFDGTGLGTITNDDSGPVPIHNIQGTGITSPFAGQTVTARGIITGARSVGFFMQSPDNEADADPNTSEGIFIYTDTPLPAGVAVGNLVSVTGQVIEFRPFADPVSPTQTEFSNGPSVSLMATGQTLPAPVTLTANDTDPAGGIYGLERYEGMRVRAPSLTVIAPTGGSANETSATGSSNGVFYGVITGLPRPMREPGIETPDPLPALAPPNVPVFDANPERLRVDSNGLTGAARLEVTTGATVTNIVGPLDYNSRSYTILPDPATLPTVSGITGARAVPTPAVEEFTVASANLQRFYDSVDDAGDDVVLTAAALQNRLRKASLMVRMVLQSPDIIGAQEVENLGVLSALAARINADAIAAGQANPNYVAFLQEGNDIGLIDVGFLVKTARVAVLDVTQFGKETTYTEPGGNNAVLHDRPPLVLRANVTATCGGVFPITIVVNHLRSLLGIADTADGPRVRAKRRAQAEFLANLIQLRQAHERVLAVGDFNSFQFNDGYADIIGAAKGTPVASDQVVLSSNDLVRPDLLNLAEMIPPFHRYSYVFGGNAQVLDHALATSNLRAFVSSVAYGRVNADFPETYRSDATRPERVSDHDPLVVYFRVTGVAESSVALSADGETYSVNVFAPTGCAWSATAVAPWLHIVAGSGNGNGVATFRADANLTTGTRLAVVAVAGRSVLVTQTGTSDFCSYFLGTNFLKDVPANGGSGTIQVNATCGWLAMSNDSWLTITSGASGNGRGTVTFSIEPNTTAPRRGTITVAGHTFVVKQLKR